MLFSRVSQLRKEKLFNQAIIALLEACCNGVYQNYTLHTGPGLKKVDALVSGDSLHHVLAITGHELFINRIDDLRVRDEARIRLPGELSCLKAITTANGLPSAFIGSEAGDVWQVTVTTNETKTSLIEKRGPAHNSIRSLTLSDDYLMYSPLGDSSLHLYHLYRKNRSLLKRNNYKNVVHIQVLSLRQNDYYALGYSDQEHTVPRLRLFDRKEKLVWGAEEIEGSVSALQVFHNEAGEAIILAGTDKSSLYAVDGRGKLRWKFKTDGTVNCMAVSSRPESKEPYVFVGSEGGTLYLLDFSGSLKWKNVFTAPIRDCALVTLSASHYPHLIVALSDNSIRSFTRSPAQMLAPLFSELLSDLLRHENCSEESLLDRLSQSDYQSIRDFAEIRRMGFPHDLALLILQYTHLGRTLDEILALILPHGPSARSLALLAEFRLTYEQKNASPDIKLKKRFEYLYQRGDMHDAFMTGCQLAYQSSDIQWITRLPHPVDHVMALDANRFIALSEKTVMLVDRLLPGRDAHLTLPATIMACFSTGERDGRDGDPAFSILTRDMKLHRFILPLGKTETISLQARGRIQGEIIGTSVSSSGALLCFTTSTNLCYIFTFASGRPEIIARFKAGYQCTVTAFLRRGGKALIVIGTRNGTILAYDFNRGKGMGAKPEEPLWSGSIEGMPESMVSTDDPRGKALLMVASSTGSVRAFDCEGTLAWEFRTITDKLLPGRAVKTIVPVRDQTDSTLHFFMLAGTYLYVVSGDGKLTKMFSLPESALCLARAGDHEAEGQSFLILFSSGRLMQVTYYLQNPFAPALHTLYRSLIPLQGEEQWLAELIRSENPALQFFAFEQVSQRPAVYESLHALMLTSLNHLNQREGILRRAIVKNLAPLVQKNWDPPLLLNTIDCDDLYQFSGLMSLLHKIGTGSRSNCHKVVAFLKDIYAATRKEANHIAILQLLEILLKDDPPKLADFLFAITPFENAPWVSQEIGILLGRALGASYAENFNLLTRCFYVSSMQELKALSKEIRDNLPLYQKKVTPGGAKALRLFSAIDWRAKESMEDPFGRELKQLKKVLTPQSYAIATALFSKWDRILKKVRTEAIALSDLSVTAWHKVETLNSQVRHSIVEGCFSGLESFSLMLKDTPADRDIIKGIIAGIKQLPMVRETLTDYFDGRIDGEVRLKDIFFTEYKTIFRELDEIDRLCAHYEKKHHHRSFRIRFASAIPQKTRTIQREALARIDIAVKKLKTDVRALLENLLEHSPVRQLLREASITVNLNLSSPDSAHFKVLAREHQLFNAFYEVMRNMLHHAFKDMPAGREKTITITGECYSRGNLYLRLTFADNGVGMTPHELARMRDISFQRGRTGDGVERVIHLIEENRGTVHYQSRKGKGTAVIITLPLKMREEQANS